VNSNVVFFEDKKDKIEPSFSGNNESFIFIHNNEENNNDIFMKQQNEIIKFKSCSLQHENFRNILHSITILSLFSLNFAHHIDLLIEREDKLPVADLVMDTTTIIGIINSKFMNYSYIQGKFMQVKDVNLLI
jgi:hypothetical protein